LGKDVVLRPKWVIPYKNKDVLAPYFVIDSYWSKMFVVQFEIPEGFSVDHFFAQKEQKTTFFMGTTHVNAFYQW
jgi:hypothetical protein